MAGGLRPMARSCFGLARASHTAPTSASRVGAVAAAAVLRSVPSILCQIARARCGKWSEEVSGCNRRYGNGGEAAPLETRKPMLRRLGNKAVTSLKTMMVPSAAFARSFDLAGMSIASKG